jgi:chromosome segregation protein
VLLQSLVREADMRTRRIAAIRSERQAWEDRRNRATTHISEVEGRQAEIDEERETLREAPDLFMAKRRTLQGEIAAGEAARRDASDLLAVAERELSEADTAARAALTALSEVREARARSEAQLEAARGRLAESVRGIAERLDTTPAELPGLAGLSPDGPLPEPEAIDRRLESLRNDRERLGAVNLRAEEELAEIEGQKERLGSERDDLTEAIKRLRSAIQSLNREGRERLLAAFEIVQGHFVRLFTSLFGGGEARLELIESDDPLEAGLEIMARPPGKKPQTMTLLSGGEQALTAIALIFAVFLTNPSPICVLDEVDAPLDDANVERYCDLLRDMAASTETRFLVITHNPITMARMDRLFGVTMAERGVSQLVSVDLDTAERFLEAS